MEDIVQKKHNHIRACSHRRSFSRLALVVYQTLTLQKARSYLDLARLMVLPERNSRAAMPLLPQGILLSTPGPLPPPHTQQKVLRDEGNGSCLPLASCFPCNLIGRQAHQNSDGRAALAGTSPRRILRQERRSEWKGVGKGREAEWLQRGGRQRERLSGWMDGQTVGWTDSELSGYDCLHNSCRTGGALVCRLGRMFG